MREVLQAAFLRFRKGLPEGARRSLRLSRHLFMTPQCSGQISAELLADCRVCASRVDLIERLPHGGCIAEVGTDRGDFAKRILTTCNPAELHIIDLDFSRSDPEIFQNSNVTTHRGDSAKILQAFPDAHFDWIYVDADHSYEAVRGDANAAATKVKPGGYLVFNDFAHIDPSLGTYGVHRAVVEFANSNEWTFAWLAYQKNALYDVALRRPAAG
jgi:SAM-dependent methyltransferase